MDNLIRYKIRESNIEDCSKTNVGESEKFFTLPSIYTTIVSKNYKKF